LLPTFRQRPPPAILALRGRCAIMARPGRIVLVPLGRMNAENSAIPLCTPTARGLKFAWKTSAPTTTHLGFWWETRPSIGGVYGRHELEVQVLDV
jgi:hypothetical protein